MRLSSNNLVFNTCQHTKLTFYGYIKLMCIFHNLLCQSNVLLIRKSTTVNHYRREAHVYTALADLETASVVEVKGDLRMSAT